MHGVLRQRGASRPHAQADRCPNPGGDARLQQLHFGSAAVLPANGRLQQLYLAAAGA